jgi:hypothetical protein
MLICMWKAYGKLGYPNELLLLVMMLLELEKEQLGVLRRALEARARDMQMRLGSDPGDEGFRREATLAIQLLRRVEALERQAGQRARGILEPEFLPEEDEN